MSNNPLFSATGPKASSAFGITSQTASIASQQANAVGMQQLEHYIKAQQLAMASGIGASPGLSGAFSAAMEPTYNQADLDALPEDQKLVLWTVDSSANRGERGAVPLIRRIVLPVNATDDNHLRAPSLSFDQLFTTEGEAQTYVRNHLRAAMRKEIGALVDDLTHKAMASGLLDDPELDLADGLRRYLSVTKA